MLFVGIDLHKRFLVVATEGFNGLLRRPKRFECRNKAAILDFFRECQPFKAVIEASCSYRWLYDLLTPLGEVVLAHPLRLRAIVSGRAKTDKLDAAMLARLLRADLIPTSYVPPPAYQQLRDLTRARARLSRRRTEAKNELHAMLARANLQSPYVNTFCKSGRHWLAKLDFASPNNIVRDEVLRRLAHYDRELVELDGTIRSMATVFPEVEALTDLRGMGLFSALLIVAEIGEPWRFPNRRTVGAYAGLTSRVNQSGGSQYYGHITRQGSPWIRWILVQVAMKVITEDPQLKNFYTRIRKRSSAMIARVATARKLAGICWLRLMRWHEARGTQAEATVA